VEEAASGLALGGLQEAVEPEYLRSFRSNGHPRTASFQPRADQPEDARIADAVFHELHQPLVIQSVEEAADVRVHHPVHRPLVSRCIDPYQMTTAPPVICKAQKAKE